MTHRSIERALPRLALLGLVWCTLTGGVFSGCSGLFTPATPERPTTPPIIPDYSSAEATLLTMIAAIQAKDQGTDAWVGAFADSVADGAPPGFYIIFDADDVRICECTVPVTWSRSEERLFYQKFMDVSTSATYGAIFTENQDRPDPTPTTADQRIFNRYYQVFATEESGVQSTIAIGRVELTLKGSGDRWIITRWIDEVTDIGLDPNDPEQKTLGRRRLE